MSLFKLYNSVKFSAFKILYKYCLYFVLKFFHNLQIRLNPVSCHFFQTLTTNQSTFYIYGFAILKISYK